MRTFLRVLLFVVVIASLAQSAHAFYQWVDENGVLHISDFPPPAKYLPKEEPPAPQAPPPPQKPAPVRPAAPAPAPPQAAPAAPAPAAVAAPRTTIPAPSTRTSATVLKTAPSATARQPLSAPTATAQAAPRQPVPITAPPPSASKPSTFTREERAAAALIAALMGGFSLVFLAVFALLYIFYAYCVFSIAKRLNVDGAWAAWVPVVNVFWPVVGAAGKPAWWIILMLIPFVNFFVNIYLWMCIAENCGKNKWLGLLLLVPLGPLFLWGYLAFSRS